MAARCGKWDRVSGDQPDGRWDCAATKVDPFDLEARGQLGETGVDDLPDGGSGETAVSRWVGRFQQHDSLCPETLRQPGGQRVARDVP